MRRLRFGPRLLGQLFSERRGPGLGQASAASGGCLSSSGVLRGRAACCGGECGHGAYLRPTRGVGA